MEKEGAQKRSEAWQGKRRFLGSANKEGGISKRAHFSKWYRFKYGI